MGIRLKFYIIFALLLPGMSAADAIKNGSLKAYSDGINVTIRWETVDEKNVVNFEILRSTNPSTGYITIATIDPKGVSVYEFVDNSALRRTTTVYYYRIKVRFSNGESYFPALNESPVTVNHNVSGVRRTWGSIKAMFR